MIVPESFSCDVCKKMRGDDYNHWHLVFTASPAITIMPWSEADPGQIKRARYHLCGLAHLLQIINQLCEAPKPDPGPAERGELCQPS